eukprot:CAMPEP_0173425052 /NCGR_PEP_ID=MMETSP1357-20121228/4848_1 /TAXON_ID=77926 /ORGANISM="Hemiselmis rufescens, Strain PCC563" /LENGTH=194 /DNA_ID=CAMNT_0014388421 /DNA_START=374 /DNA_END=955 /DNA_ORIENTATION=-
MHGTYLQGWGVQPRLLHPVRDALLLELREELYATSHRDNTCLSNTSKALRGAGGVLGTVAVVAVVRLSGVPAVAQSAANITILASSLACLHKAVQVVMSLTSHALFLLSLLSPSIPPSVHLSALGHQALSPCSASQILLSKSLFESRQHLQRTFKHMVLASALWCSLEAAALLKVAMSLFLRAVSCVVSCVVSR